MPLVSFSPLKVAPALLSAHPSVPAQDPAKSKQEKQENKKDNQKRNKPSSLAVAKWFEAHIKQCWQKGS